jgi:uncharacterized membrane protein (UPF0127 family)
MMYMKLMERIVMVAILICIVGGGSWIYFAVQHDRSELREAVARGDFEIRKEEQTETTIDDWERIYPSTVPVMIASTSVQASVADTLAERIKGLSNTPFLPPQVVKLFVFESLGSHEIWMKDMNYSIDIIWADQDGYIVHIEERVSPETYPQSFGSPVPAWFVVETSAGFVEANGIQIGDKITR